MWGGERWNGYKLSAVSTAFSLCWFSSLYCEVFYSNGSLYFSDVLYILLFFFNSPLFFVTLPSSVLLFLISPSSCIILADLLSCDVAKHTCKNVDLELVELLSQKLIEALQGNSMNKHPRQISGKTHICTCMHVCSLCTCMHAYKWNCLHKHTHCTVPHLAMTWGHPFLLLCACVCFSYL